jgi:hypothetical protein
MTTAGTLKRQMTLANAPVEVGGWVIGADPRFEEPVEGFFSEGPVVGSRFSFFVPKKGDGVDMLHTSVVQQVADHDGVYTFRTRNSVYVLETESDTAR